MVERTPSGERFQERTRVYQRCPNCDLRADVSLHVAGALIRCAHCGVRFQVARPHAHAPDDPTAWEEVAAVGGPEPPSPARGSEPGSPPDQSKTNAPLP